MVFLCFIATTLWSVLRGSRIDEFIAVGISSAGVVTALWFLRREHDRKVADAGAKEAESKFFAATEVSLDAFSLLESVRNAAGQIVDFRIQYVNANGEKLTGHSRDQLLGQSLCDRMPILKATGLFDRCCQVVETGTPLNQEYPVPKGNLIQAA